jgi:hypothetical protein
MPIGVEDGIFHTNCGKGCEQAHHFPTKPLILIKIHVQARFLGRLAQPQQDGHKTVARPGRTAV